MNLKMLPIAKIFTILALLCAITQAETHMSDAAVNTNYSKNYVSGYSDHRVLPHTIAFADHNFIYMTCNATEDMYSEVLCNVTMEISDNTRKHCNIDYLVPIKNDPSLDPATMRIDRMGDKVVFQLPVVHPDRQIIHKTSESREIIVIDMDKCTMHHLEFPTDELSYYYEVVVYNDRFDVYSQNKELCGNYSKCVVRYDHNGEQIGKPTNFSASHCCILPVFSIPVDRSQPEKGFYSLGLQIDISEKVLHFTHTNDEGNQTNLFTFPAPQINDFREVTKCIKTSNEHEYIGLCYRPHPKDTKAICLQYNAAGQKMMNATVEIKENDMMVNVFNLRQGGIGFVNQVFNDSPSNTTFETKLVHPDGRVEKGLSFVENECVTPDSDNVIDHMETENEHCFHFACAEYLSVRETSFKYRIKCFKNTSLYHETK